MKRMTTILIWMAAVGLGLFATSGCYHQQRTKEARCGDRVCDTWAGETHKTCPSDCPTVASTCGNGVCDGEEDERSCPADCASTPGRYCGNGRCDFGESHDNCPEDCPVLSPVCGDGRCEPGEAETCPSDCRH